jgi:hypothetical protein
MRAALPNQAVATPPPQPGFDHHIAWESYSSVIAISIALSGPIQHFHAEQLPLIEVSRK